MVTFVTLRIMKIKVKFVVGVRRYGDEGVIEYNYEVQEEHDSFFNILNDVIDRYYNDSYNFFERLKIIIEQQDIQNGFYIRVELYDKIKSMFIRFL